MNTSELRIGNILRVDYDFLPINGVKENKVYFKGTEWSIENSHSVLLTDEWLLKLGFELCNGYYHEFIDGFRAEIRVKLKGTKYSFWFKRNNSSVWINEIEYVHELQNLFFSISGEELKIKNL